MATRLVLGDVTIDVVRKDIRNLHLSVNPPAGAVRIAAPRHADAQMIRAFAIRKLGWIRAQQRKLRAQEREPRRALVERESHYVWGRRVLLKLVEHDAAASIELRPRSLVLAVRPGTESAKRTALLDAWYRATLKAEAAALIDRWQKRLGVQVRRLYVQRMKTKWGSCDPRAGSIRLNTELAKKPPGCLEYLVVHELLHLIEPNHNARFRSLLDRFLPAWQERRAELNRLPVAHQDWKY